LVGGCEIATCVDIVAQHRADAREGTRHQLDHMVANRWAESGVQIVRARLEASEGNILAASARLEALYDTHAARGWPEFETYVATCIYCQSFDIARRAIASRLPSLARTTFHIDTDTTWHDKPGVSRFIKRAETVEFHLGPGLFPREQDLALRRFVALLPMFAGFCGCRRQDQGSTHVNSGDNAFAPGLAFSADKRRFFLVPDADFARAKGYQAERELISAHWVPYRDRRPVAFWRGGTQGTSFSDWRGLQRIRLCEIGATDAGRHRCDFGITHIVRSHVISQADAADIKAAGLERPFVPLTDFCKYRFQVDVDGHSNSWTGLLTKLLTGSPVLKVASLLAYEQWYYADLIPFQNYVPVAPDLSDLLEKIDWLSRNEARAEAIGWAGLELASRLTFDREMHRAQDTIALALRFPTPDDTYHRDTSRVLETIS
jgi:hypothetical protein